MGVPLPEVVAVLVVVAEVVGGAALILGIATRWFALILAIEMVVTTFVIKMPSVGLVDQWIAAPAQKST